MFQPIGRSRRARRTTPKLEGLEGRQLLSGGIAPHPPTPTPPSPISGPPPVIQPPLPGPGQ